MRALTVLLAVLALAGCHNRAGDEESYTLYMDIFGDGRGRVHIATFDSAIGGRNGLGYNEKVSWESNGRMCSYAADALRAAEVAQQPTTKIKFWCEPGTFRR